MYELNEIMPFPSTVETPMPFVVTQDPFLASFLVNQPPPLGHVKSMALDPRPDPGMLRAMASSLEGLEEATDKLQGASEWAVEGHFLVTTRALIR